MGKAKRQVISDGFLRRGVMDLADVSTARCVLDAKRTMTGNGRKPDIRRAAGSSEKLLNFLRTLLRCFKRCPPSNKGFTAIELIAVIVVLGMLAISVIVKNPFAIDDYSAIAADQLIANIRLAQLNAMGMKKAQSVTFFVNSADYGIYDLAGTRKKLPGNVAITGSSTISNPLIFDSLGTPSTSGRIYLSGGDYITVHPLTGNVE